MDAGAEFLDEVAREEEKMAPASAGLTYRLENMVGFFPTIRRMEEELFTKGDPETVRPGYLPDGDAHSDHQDNDDHFPKEPLLSHYLPLANVRIVPGPVSWRQSGLSRGVRLGGEAPDAAEKVMWPNPKSTIAFVSDLPGPCAALGSPQERWLIPHIEASASEMAKIATGWLGLPLPPG